MRSEAEIRKQVETRLRRWGLLVLNGILWVGTVKLIFVVSENYNYSDTEQNIGILIMAAWLILLGLHALRVFYVELREWLVRRAIERERQFYLLQDAYEKRKRDESFPRVANDSFPRLSDDGELIDFPAPLDEEVKVKHERRS